MRHQLFFIKPFIIRESPEIMYEKRPYVPKSPKKQVKVINFTEINLLFAELKSRTNNIDVTMGWESTRTFDK